jgi:signal transduction histidine kinase
MALKGWLADLSSTRYREFLDVPGIARAHDYQRVFSYGLGGIAVVALGASPWRVTVVVAVCALLTLLAGRRLILRREPAPLPLAIVDLVLATVVVAVATGSAAITLLMPTIVGFAVIATFEVPVGRSIALVLLTGLTSMGIAMSLSPGGSPEVSPAILAFVVVALMLVIAILILAFFTMQSNRLRTRLTSREAELSTLLSVTPVVLATIGETGRIVAIAGVDSGWLGSPGELVTGVVAESIDEVRDGHRTDEDLTVDGRVFNVTCVPGPRGTVLLTAIDITERERARQRLEELIRSKDSFVAAISHELRTPLTAVLGFAEEVKSQLNPTDPSTAMVEVIADQSAEMSAIIEDLLVAARAEQGTVSITSRPIDLAEEATVVACALRGRLLSQPVLQVDSTPSLADPLRLRQIIRNLMTNADRYGGDRTVVTTYHDGGMSVLEVRDNGSALDDEHRERMFEPYTSSGPVRGEPAAMGLGLSVSRTLAQLMGGDLVYDHQDGWSVFRLRVPALVAAEI